MIKRLSYQEIDFEKYNQCVENSIQKNFYCDKETLDFLCKNWELLVYNDYEAVMPIPFTKKLVFKVVDMPLFCQQLGVFSKENNTVINQKFLEYLNTNYNVINYQFNHENRFESLTTKKNYIIPVQEYAFLRRKKYFKGRKSTVKTAQYLEFKEVFISDEILEFTCDNFKGLEKQSDLDFFIKYLFFLKKSNKLKMFGSYFENQLTNITILTADSKSFSLLGLINNEALKEHNGASFLIDRILQENIENKSFNFMGGSIRGIEVFFKSFGSELQEYQVIQNSKKDIILNCLKIS
ncbi:hypothetical protein [Epilithonimonas arachidiradicis]|uniref:Acetyltransferase (GNAT) family protein n=1 Tax=Epilithonimonas arachidiradicis TaxID=1617282 RepID=A0A420CX97_9FLAO|nr:hypothetical protein [Epilithonimonas arachidiradicis]RKE83114.1 hypothetical protein BXY58_2665 [Epilithonimonas arachidiradicis]GGG65055.1 hypothetical protein GCM10007332_29410 [Epilithonimonas arachidiradicis]